MPPHYLCKGSSLVIPITGDLKQARLARQGSPPYSVIGVCPSREQHMPTVSSGQGLAVVLLACWLFSILLTNTLPSAPHASVQTPPAPSALHLTAFSLTF